MTRAVIELSTDIGPLLSLISRKIEGSAYFPVSKLVTFNKGNCNIIMSSKEINIYKVENETEAMSLADWIKNILDDDKD